MKIISSKFSDYNSHIYSNNIGRFGAKIAHNLFYFVEGAAIKALKGKELLLHRENHKEIDLAKRLIKKEDSPWNGNIGKERECAQKIFGEIKDETWGDKVKRFTKAAGYLSCAVAMSPLALPAAAIWLTARKIAQENSNDYVCLKAEESKTWKPGQDISFLNFNVALTESRIMNHVNGMSDTKQRAKEIAKFLKEQSADVICLQEAFDVDEITPTIGIELQKLGYNVVIASKREKVLGLNSGLVFASKFEIEDIDSIRFSNLISIDARAKKGVVNFNLKLNDHDTISVSNTHMQGSFKGNEKAVKVEMRKYQFNEIKEFNERVIDHEKVRDEFVIGDFNTERFRENKEGVVEIAYDYSALEEFSETFKDLNFPDRDKSFDTPVEFEIKPEYNETGEAKGTSLDTSAASFKFFKEILLKEIEAETSLKKSELKQLIDKRLEKVDIGDARISKIIDDAIKNLVKNVYVKNGVTDHVCLKKKENNLFDETNYTYKTIIPYGKSGILSDHRAVKVTLSPK